MRTIIHLGFAALLCTVPLPARAHDGPEHEIDELTEKMEKHGETAGWLSERAVEYVVLAKYAEASKDLERAGVLDPASMLIQRELAKVQFLGGKDKDALATATRALSLKTEDPSDVASVRMLRAEILRFQNENKKALEDCDAALKLHKQNPEWYLLRSDLQRRLKAHKERLAGLDEGIKETGAAVLEIERVEALIDAGQFAAALKIADAELADTRIKSSWLIRRSRALLGLGKKDLAESGLKDALEEIATRLNPKSPDGPLLLDKALAYELLGDKKEALRIYEEARDKGAADRVNERIKALQDPAAPATPATTPDDKDEPKPAGQ